MKLSDLLTPAQCSAAARYADKGACLGGIASRAAAALGANASTILEALRHREALGSTGLGAGLALPHARIDGLAKPYLAVARLRAPIDFDYVDERLVDIVCLILLPADGPVGNDILACAVRRLRDEVVLAAMRKAKDPQAMHDALVGT